VRAVGVGHDLDYTIGLVVTAALLVYLTYALLRPENSDDLQWLFQILLFLAVVLALTAPLAGS